MGVTIKDIALRAGVSKSTVSRVISGKGFASKEAQEKVWKAVEELQYKPNRLARAMVSNKTDNIGVIFFKEKQYDTEKSVYESIIGPLLEKAHELNYSIFIALEENESSRHIDYMLEKRVDGLILINLVNHEVINYLCKFHIPCVIINGTETDHHLQISNHEINGGRIAAEYLYQLGHRNIWVLTCLNTSPNELLRFQGFCERFNELGGQINTEDILYSTAATFEAGFQTVARAWNYYLEKQPTAIFATDDYLAIGAMKFFLTKGVHIPEELSIMGFNDIDLSKLFHPSLTTIQIDKVKMAEDAVSKLVELINNKEIQPEKVTYDPKLMIRESTRSPK